MSSWVFQCFFKLSHGCIIKGFRGRGRNSIFVEITSSKISNVLPTVATGIFMTLYDTSLINIMRYYIVNSGRIWRMGISIVENESANCEERPCLTICFQMRFRHVPESLFKVSYFLQFLLLFSWKPSNLKPLLINYPLKPKCWFYYVDDTTYVFFYSFLKNSIYLLHSCDVRANRQAWSHSTICCCFTIDTHHQILTSVPHIFSEAS